jgi:hypothetical protein
VRLENERLRQRAWRGCVPKLWLTCVIVVGEATVEREAALLSRGGDDRKV